jgi:hypothetical protein
VGEAARRLCMTGDECSPNPTVSCSTRTPTTTNGKCLSRKPGYLHDAATVLAILAVPTPTAMAIMGWSSAEMAARYQHVIDSIREGVADQVGGLLWGTDDGPDGETPTDDCEVT